MALILSSPAVAKDKLVPVFSMGDNTCGEWVRSSNDHDLRSIYLFWFRGFVSGYNYGDKDFYVKGNMPSNESLTLYIDKYCRENPLKDFTLASFLLVTELKQQR